MNSKQILHQQLQLHRKLGARIISQNTGKLKITRKMVLNPKASFGHPSILCCLLFNRKCETKLLKRHKRPNKNEPVPENKHKKS